MPDTGDDRKKMGFNATWSMAVGGMLGGGIFTVLGVVISLAGHWAFASFILAGLVALATGHSYVQLAAKYGESGGAFTFLRHAGMKDLAGSLSWVLIAGYVLTWRLATREPTTLAALGGFTLVAIAVRPWLLRGRAADDSA